MAFGTKEVDPVKVELKSPRIELANIEHNKEALRLNLDLIEKKTRASHEVCGRLSQEDSEVL